MGDALKVGPAYPPTAALRCLDRRDEFACDRLIVKHQHPATAAWVGRRRT